MCPSIPLERALLVAFLWFAGIQPAPAGLLVEHRPAYAAGSAITYSATARSALGIEQIDLAIVARRLACADGVPTLHEIVDEDEVSISSDPQLELTLAEAFGPYPLNTWVTVRSTALRPNGTFFVHRYHHTANLTGDVIACIGALPVYIGGDGTYAPSNFNLLFVADAESKTWGEYLTRVGDIVFDYPDVGTPGGDVGLLDDRQYGLVKDRINLFVNDFAYKGAAGCPPDAGLEWEDPPNDPRGSLPFLDVFLFTHALDFQDCATLSQPSKSGSLARASAMLPAVAAHELGHALLGLLDEYSACVSCNVNALGPHPNLFPSEQACRDHVAAAHPFGDPDDCWTYPFQERYRWCPTGDVMDKNTDLSRPDEGEEVSQLAALVSDLPTSGASGGASSVIAAPPRARPRRTINRDLRRSFGGQSLRVRVDLDDARSTHPAVETELVRGRARLPRGVDAPVLDPTVPPTPTLEVRIDDRRGETFYRFRIADNRPRPGPPGTPAADTRPGASDVVSQTSWDIVIPWAGRIRARAARFRLVDGDGRVIAQAPLPPRSTE